MESDIIKISHLNKSFGEVKAVNDLSIMFCLVTPMHLQRRKG